MKRKIVWLILSSLLVAALLVSCAPAVTEEEEVVVPPTEEEVVVTEEEEVAPPPEEEEEAVTEEEVAPSPPPKPPTPPPAKFELTSLGIEPPEVMAGETVCITAEVKNTGGSRGAYPVILTVEGIEVETKDVTVASGAIVTVTFGFIKDAVGIYRIEVAELTGVLIVKGPEGPPSGYIVEKELDYEGNQIEIHDITYMSDGLKVKGYLAQPKGPIYDRRRTTKYAEDGNDSINWRKP